MQAELSVDGVELTDDHRVENVVDVELRCSCDRPSFTPSRCDQAGPSARLSVRLMGPRAAVRTVSLAGVEPALWVRTVVLVTQELLADTAGAEPLEITSTRAPDAPWRLVRIELGARALVLPRTPTAGGGALLGAGLRAGDLPIEGLVEVGFVYVEHGAANGIAAASTDVRLGGRAWLGLEPWRLGVELAVTGSHLWVARRAVGRELQAFGLGIDLVARVEVALGEGVSLSLSVGARGYLVGVDVLIGGEPGVGFVDVLPLGALGVAYAP